MNFRQALADPRFNEIRKQAPKWSEDVIQQLDEIGDAFSVFGTRLLIDWGKLMIRMIEWIQQVRGGTKTAAARVGGATAHWKPKDFLIDFLTLGKVNPGFNKEAGDVAEMSAPANVSLASLIP